MNPLEKDYSMLFSSPQYQNLIAKLVKHKKNNEGLSKKLSRFQNERDVRQILRNMGQCGTFVSASMDEAGEIKIEKSNFCRERVCSICAWRRQAKFIATTYPALDILSKSYKMLFVTLTVRNEPEENLKKTVDELLLAYSNLLKYKQLKAVKGYVRSVEMTYNTKLHTYHPHIHAIWLVEERYFLDGSYIAQSELAQLWARAAKLDYEPVVDIRKIRQKGERIPYVESMKYALKPQEGLGARQILTYARILKGRRLITFGGVVARLRKLDLENLNDDNGNPNGDTVPVKYAFVLKFNASGGLYEISEVFENEN